MLWRCQVRQRTCDNLIGYLGFECGGGSLWLFELHSHVQDTCLPINALAVNVFVFSKKKGEREREREREIKNLIPVRPFLSHLTFHFNCCNDYLLFSSKDIKKIQAISSGELLWRQKSISLLLTLTNSLLI